MKFFDEKYFISYCNLIGNRIADSIKSFDFSETETTVGYTTQASAVYSSNIEGNTIDLNSFMNYKLLQDKFKPQKEIQEIENLILAYKFAQSNNLTEKSFLHCHKILSKTLVPKNRQGIYRNEKVGVFGQSGLVYLAIEPEFVKPTMTDFFLAIDELLQQHLTEIQSFYFASFIHLTFAHIHPFNDGNGRAARLLEKWFLTQKLGKQFWKLSSEKYYKEHQSDYYNNINLGVNYYELHYDKCLPFLIMLAQSIENK
jgi:Fic family protein